MTTVLHVSASPRGERSESLALARLFLDTYAEQDPDATIEEWDLWDGSVPEFGAAATEGKMNTFAGIDLDGPAVAAWRQVTATFERFAAADAYLFSLPMWNAGIPYKLKQLIDVVSQPGMVFSFDPEAGYTPLLRGRQAAVLYTSAIYAPGRGPAFGSDFQAPYLRDWLAWAGIDDVREVFFRPTIATADPDTLRRVAREETVRLARELARQGGAAPARVA